MEYHKMYQLIQLQVVIVVCICMVIPSIDAIPSALNSNRGNRALRSSEIIVYPDNIPQRAGCKELFCTGIRDYPHSEISSLLRKASLEIKSFFVEDLEPEVLTQRFSGPDGNTLCQGVMKKIYPEESMNRNGTWKTIVNSGDYRQGIVVETCVSEKPSEMAKSVFPPSYKVGCRQKYIFRPLITYKKETNQLEPDYFQVPTCCEFYYDLNE